jgi:Ca2+/Na+ antiporter
MPAVVFGPRHQFQVRQIVIGSILIAVVNVLPRFKVAAEVALHHQSML